MVNSVSGADRGKFFLSIATIAQKQEPGFGTTRGRTEPTHPVKPSNAVSPVLIKVNDEQRFHAAVEIVGEDFVGLLDSGAQISVVGP